MLQTQRCYAIIIITTNGSIATVCSHLKNLTMKYLLIFIVGVVFTSCSGGKPSKYGSEADSIRAVIDSMSKKHVAINRNLLNGLFIKDSMEYSPEFINSLVDNIMQTNKEKGVNYIGFFGERVIINKNDTILIPTDLPLDLNITYIASKNGTDYLLTLKRIRITDVYYELRINNKLQRFGIATLNSSTLIFGNETGMDDQPFFADEYLDKTDCKVNLRIECDTFTKVDMSVADCDNKLKNIPILRKK